MTTSNKLDSPYVQHSSGQAPGLPFHPEFSDQSEQSKASYTTRHNEQDGGRTVMKRHIGN
jgi:hypothetical protein